MLLEKEKEVIETLAKEFDVKRVWLFGSSLDEAADPGDIDLAVEGVPGGRFFDLYAKLIAALDRPVDLIDMAVDPPIAIIIRKTGRVIYG
jgi:predicted nucleotidyltransferase